MSDLDWGARYGRLWEAARCFLFRLDDDGGLETLLPDRDNLLGLPLASWLGQALWSRVYPKDLSRAREMVRRALAGREPERFRVRLHAAGGALHSVDCTLMRHEAGVKAGVIGFGSDVTARVRSEEGRQRMARQLAAAEQITHVGSWEWRLESQDVSWSDELYRIYGLEPQSQPMTVEGFLSRLVAEDRPGVQHSIGEALARAGPFAFDERIVRPDGSVRVLESRGETLAGPDGAVAGLLGICRDVTEERRRAEAHVRAEQALQRAEERYRELVQSVRAVVWRGGPPLFRFAFVSQQVEGLLGYPVRRWLDEPTFFHDHLHPDDREWVMSFSARATAECRDHELEYRMLAADGRVVWLREAVRVLAEAGEPRELVGVMFDVSERRQAEERLRRSRERLRDLSAHVEWAREEERTRIAREIHDDLGQSLTALKMDLAWLQARVAGAPGELGDKVRGMAELADDTIDRVRRIARELRPGVLDDLGIEAAMEWLAQDFQGRTGITCDFASTLDAESLGRDVATGLFRIAQEALTNVARHAHAKHVGLVLFDEPGRVGLEVRDDGMGIAHDALAGSKSLGLLGMRERARRLGGSLAIARAPGRGTSVTVSVPLPVAEPASR